MGEEGGDRQSGQGQLHSAHGSLFGLEGGCVIAGSVGVMPTEVVPSHPLWGALSVGCGHLGPRLSPCLIAKRETVHTW